MSAIHAKIDALELIAQSMTDDERRRAVEEITESHYSEYGDYPDPRSLERLANVMLGKALKSRNKRGPTPVYTDAQLDSIARRNGQPVPLDHVANLSHDDLGFQTDYENHVRAQGTPETRIAKALDANPNASLREIASMANVSHETVRRYVNQNE